MNAKVVALGLLEKYDEARECSKKLWSLIQTVFLIRMRNNMNKVKNKKIKSQISKSKTILANTTSG
jgi:hypothetical protein